MTEDEKNVLLSVLLKNRDSENKPTTTIPTIKPKTNYKGMWTDEETEKLKYLYSTGAKMDFIAESLNRTAAGVQQRIYLFLRFGSLKKRVEENIPKKEKTTQIKNQEIPKRPNPHIWKQEEIEKMLTMLNEGKNVLEVADALKRTKPSVAFRIVNMMNTDDFVVVFRKKVDENTIASTQASQPVAA